NANVVKLTKNLINESYAELNKQGGVELLFVGKKGLDAFKYFEGEKNKTFSNILVGMNFENVSRVADHIISLFENNEYDRVDVVYNMFKNAAVQITTVEQYLPIATTPT